MARMTRRMVRMTRRMVRMTREVVRMTREVVRMTREVAHLLHLLGLAGKTCQQQDENLGKSRGQGC